MGCFSLSLKHPEGIAHFPIVRKDSGLYELTGTHKGFTTLPDLIDHFKHHPISEDPHRQLSYPCYRVIHAGECKWKLDAWKAREALPVPDCNLDPSSLTVEDTPPSEPTQTTLPPVPLPRRHLTAGKHTANSSKGKGYPNGKKWLLYSNVTCTSQLMTYSSTRGRWTLVISDMPEVAISAT